VSLADARDRKLPLRNLQILFDRTIALDLTAIIAFDAIS
jgi:hypothetical protein